MLVLCHDELKADIITSLLLGAGNLMNLDAKYQEDPEVVRAAVRFDGMQLQYAHGAPRKDRSIVLSVIARNGFAMKFAPKDFNAEREVVLMAVKSNAFSITLADSSLQNDCNFAIESTRLNPFVRDYLDRSIVENEKFVNAFSQTNMAPGTWHKWDLAPSREAPPTRRAPASEANTKTKAPAAAEKHGLISCLLPRLKWCRMQSNKGER